ncbi:hypothetical protein ASD98_22450 [Flavobacterium sp. Root186]|nr:hypothetical protein ASD98_22450 [Flavobacterium sp. Root186]
MRTTEAAVADIVELALLWWEVKSLTGLISWRSKIVIDIINELIEGVKSLSWATPQLGSY